MSEFQDTYRNRVATDMKRNVDFIGTALEKFFLMPFTKTSREEDVAGADWRSTNGPMIYVDHKWQREPVALELFRHTLTGEWGSEAKKLKDRKLADVTAFVLDDSILLASTTLTSAALFLAMDQGARLLRNSRSTDAPRGLSPDIGPGHSVFIHLPPHIFEARVREAHETWKSDRRVIFEVDMLGGVPCRRIAR